MISIPQPKEGAGNHLVSMAVAANEEDGFRDTFGYAVDSANNRFHDHDQQNHVWCRYGWSTALIFDIFISVLPRRL